MRNVSIKRFVGLVSTAALVGAAGSASAAPALRRQITQAGDFALIGNSLAQDCRAATPAPVVGTVGTCPPNTTGTSGNGPDVFWESDFPAAGQATASTAITLANARSTAVLQLPAGATVTAAYLYWGARPGIGNGADLGAVLERPGSGGFSAAVTALTSWSNMGSNLPSPAGNNYPGYQSVADVTALVQQAGAGAFRVGGVDSLDVTQYLASNTAVGWWMVVFYHDPAAPIRQVTLFDGFDLMGPSNPLHIDLTGFSIPAAGFTAQLGAVAYGGDVTATGEAMQFNGNTISDALNPANNFLNGTRSFLGVPVSNAGDLPQLAGTAGSLSELDLDVFDVTPYVAGGQTSATIDLTNTGDFAWLGGLVTSVTTLAPDLTTSTKTVTDLTSPGSPHAGDILQYTITVTNTGTDTAVGTVLADPLPAGVTYVPGSIQITTGANAGAKTDAAGDDQGEYVGAMNAVQVRLGTGANGSMGGSLAPGASTVITFKVQINAGATGSIANQATITAAGLSGAPSTTYPTDGNGAASGAPPTTITLASCPIATCACLADSDCGGPTSGTVCDNGNGGTFTCIPGCRGTGGNGCMTGLVCSSTTSAIGTCAVPTGCNVDADCSGGKWCKETNHTCADKIANGGPIPTDPPHMSPTLNGTCTAAAGALVCQSGVCDANDNKCGYATGDGPCTQANGGTVCRSGACSANGGVCIPAGGCAVDADCAANQWCDTPAFACTPKIPNGQAVPSAAGHNPTLNGTCTTAAGAAVCASGVCDTNDNLCGYADGDGPCTQANGGTVCRSGLCSASGVCIPTATCNTDADCPANDWCNVSAHQCTPKLANGTQVPTDSGHTNPTLDGTCTAAAGALVCASGVCDTSDNLCGYATGDGPCTQADGAAVCRSGLCATAGPNAGLCVACLADTDCPAGTPICSSTNQCVACTMDADCGGSMSGKVCGPAFTCIDGCRGALGNGCPSGDMCTSIDDTIGMCVPSTCLSDADCGGPQSGKVCGLTGTCIDGCRGMSGNGCPTGLVCTSFGSDIGQCVQCTQDSDCGGPQSGKICDPAANTCGDGCRATGNGCPTGETCSSFDDTPGTCKPNGAGGNGAGGGGTGGGGTDGIVASGSGLICAAQPGPSDGGGAWLAGGLALALLALRRRRGR
jgi:uncharacterized repeat protein (TIGR01451 family)/MYXO-CTERM domain-containing protein